VESIKHPISMMPFANMAPYRLLGEPQGCEWVCLTPRESSAALRDGRVLAAALPTGDLPELAASVDFLGEFGIAAAGTVGSVLLFSDRPFDQMAAPACVRLTDQSSSSVRLLYLLLGYRHGFDHMPHQSSGAHANGEMLIGDEALLRNARADSPYVTDLAAEWFLTHGLPFVFARWVIRRDAPREVRSAMLEWLDKLRGRDDELALASAAGEAERLGLSAQTMIRYLRGMKRILGPQELKGQELFLEELKRHGRRPLFTKAMERKN